MPELDFYTHFARTGEVLGAGLGDRPGAFAALGEPRAEVRERTQQHRDYGLVTVAFAREDGQWRAHMISLDLHALPTFPAPAAIIQRYGELTGRVPFVDLRAALAETGVDLTERADLADELRCFLLPGGVGSVHVVAGEDLASVLGFTVGDVWSISRATGSRS